MWAFFYIYIYIYIYIYSVCVYRGSMRILKSFIQWLYFMFIIDWSILVDEQGMILNKVCSDVWLFFLLEGSEQEDVLYYLVTDLFSNMLSTRQGIWSFGKSCPGSTLVSFSLPPCLIMWYFMLFYFINKYFYWCSLTIFKIFRSCETPWLKNTIIIIGCVE